MNDTQLAQGDPAARHLLAALGGNKDSLSWLDHHHKGLSVFARALTNGGSKGLDGLKALDPAAWDELFDTVCNDGLEQALKDRHPDVYLLFEAVKGDEEALAQLKRKKRSYGKLVEVIREAHEKYLLSSAEEVGKDCIPSSAAADVGCLIGELHLSKGEYHKAIEAFSRAIENEPTADVYEGRARAYRALAEQDEQKAASMKQT
jgi:tetratricopeptide (TPR) repeat protein